MVCVCVWKEDFVVILLMTVGFCVSVFCALLFFLRVCLCVVCR